MWKKYIIKIITIIGAFLLGVVLRQGLSSKIITEKLLGKDIITNINYVYTFGIKEIITVLVFTAIVYICFCMKYIESKTSLSELKATFSKIVYIEFLIFSFTIGTCLQSGLDSILLFIILIIVVLAIEIIFSIEGSYKLEKTNDENRKELYKSREELLERLKIYLSNMDAVAITGAWGIGKTVFLNEFFYQNRKNTNAKIKYEEIYIDVSIFTENKRIVEKIERDLNNILEKHGILKIKDKLLNGLGENNSWCKSILSFFKLELEDKNQNLENKIKELKTKNKSVVLCLDNFERISDKTRIINLLAIIDERIPKGIKRIYLYDEEYMEELFSEKKVIYFNGNIEHSFNIKVVKADENLDIKGFKEYFNKYIEHSFSIKDAKIEEILNGSSDLKKIIKKIISRSDSLEKELVLYEKSTPNYLEKKYDKEIFNSYSKEEKQKEIEKEFLKKEIAYKLNKINDNFRKKLRIPRYLEQLKKFVGKIDIENKRYELEWKIIYDFFGNISVQKLGENSFKYINNIFNNIDEVLEEDGVNQESICLIYLFFNEKLLDNYDRLKVYKNEEKDKYEKEIEEIEKNIQGKLTRGLTLIYNRYSGDEKLSKYNEFLRKGVVNKKKYIIDSSDELRALVLDFKDEIDKVDYFFLEKIILDENGRYEDGGKETSVIDYRESIIKLYLKYNKNIEILLQFILSREKIEDYNNNHSNFEKVLKSKLEVDSLEEIVKKLKEKLDKKYDGQFDKQKEKLIKQLSLISKSAVDDIKKSLIFAEKILKLPSEPISGEKKKVIDEEYFINKRRIDILRDIEEERGEIKLSFEGFMGKESIVITRDNVEEYRKELQDNLTKELDEDKKESKKCLLIELIKFGESTRKKVEIEL